MQRASDELNLTGLFCDALKYGLSFDKRYYYYDDGYEDKRYWEWDDAWHVTDTRRILEILKEIKSELLS